LKGFNLDRSLKTPFGQMTISFMGGDEDTGVSGIASKSSFVKTGYLIYTSAISLGAVIWSVDNCSELISVVSCF